MTAAASAPAACVLAGTEERPRNGMNRIQDSGSGQLESHFREGATSEEAYRNAQTIFPHYCGLQILSDPRRALCNLR